MTIKDWMTVRAEQHTKLALHVAKDDYPKLAEAIVFGEISTGYDKDPYLLFKDVFEREESDDLVFYLYRTKVDRWILQGFDRPNAIAYPERKAVWLSEFLRQTSDVTDLLFEE